MSTVDVATLKAHAEELIAKAIAGEATIIEQNGKHAVLMPCEGAAPDFELDRETDMLLRERMESPGNEPSPADWEKLRQGIRRK
jgi:antitoxin (DNA-binding transcriptional repressor) of toxin-antitoxin stability system